MTPSFPLATSLIQTFPTAKLKKGHFQRPSSKNEQLLNDPSPFFAYGKIRQNVALPVDHSAPAQKVSGQFPAAFETAPR